MTCNASKQCINAPGETCETGSNDGRLPDNGMCNAPGWSFIPSNVPCEALETPTDVWNFQGDGTLVATDPGLAVPGTPPVQKVVNGYAVILATDVNIALSANISIVGGGGGPPLPVIIAATSTITIKGTLYGVGGNPAASIVPQYCMGSPGGVGGDAPACAVGGYAGGGGGGFGETGGTGSPCTTTATPGGSPGVFDSNTSLVPLRLGCRGGKGVGADAAGSTSYGGYGGAAIQLSAPNILIEGTIDVNGGGGSSGASGDGGGGGGTGGAILIEGSSGTIAGTARICANGGGGGGESNPGARGTCLLDIPTGGVDGGTQHGGNGGYGGIGPTAGNGGGGGGGGVGRIHISGVTTQTGAVVTPAAM